MCGGGEWRARGVGGCHTQWSEGARCGYTFTYPCSGRGCFFLGGGTMCGVGVAVSGVRVGVGGCHTRWSKGARRGYTFTYPCSGRGVFFEEGDNVWCGGGGEWRASGCEWV